MSFARNLLNMSAGQLKPHTHPPKLHAIAQVKKVLIPQNIYHVQLSKALDLVSDFSNYARKGFWKCYMLYYTFNKYDQDNYQIYNAYNFNYYAASTNKVV